MQAVQANNELRELLIKEKKEIERILAELSAEAAAHRETIAQSYDNLVALDVIFAKAETQLQHEGHGAQGQYPGQGGFESGTAPAD